MKTKIPGMIFALLLLCLGPVSAQDRRLGDIAINQNETPRSISQKPALTDAAQYISVNGNDANDGLSQNSAKKTWDAACEALPGGSAGTCGSGQIHVLKAAPANSNANYGRWLMGPGDPNYASPPAGWEKYSDPIYTDCAGGAAFGPHGSSATCTITGGSASSAGYPGIWLSDFAGGFQDDNISVQPYLLSPIRIGICSNGNRASCGVSAVHLTGTSQNLGNCALGGGPGIDIGNGVFWLYLDNVTPSGCGAEDFAGVSLSRDGAGNLTATTSTTNDWAVNQWVTTAACTDTSLNGSFQVTSVSGTPQTVVGWTQQGPATTGTCNMVSEKSAAIAVDPAGGGGSGLIFIRNSTFSNGGMWLVGNGGMYAQNISMEGNAVSPYVTPPMFLDPQLVNNTYVQIIHMEPSDINAVNTNYSTVEIDGTSCPSSDYVQLDQIGGRITGCASVRALSPASFGAQTQSPLVKNQPGIYNGKLYAQTDAAARLFGPSAIRYANIVQEFDPSTWTFDLGSGTITTGIAAPDGTNNGGQAVGSGGAAYIKFYQHSQTISVGEIFAYAVWARSQTANGFVGGFGPLQFSFSSHGGGAGDACTSNSILNPWPGFTGDGQWVRVWGICKVSANPTTASVTLYGAIDTAHTIQFYEPTLIDIPAGTLSDNEAWALASNLSVYPPSCEVGTVCGLKAPFVLSGVPRIVYNTPSPSTNSNISAVTIVPRTSAEHDYLDAWTVSLNAGGAGCTGRTTVDIEAIFTDPEAKSPTTETLGTVTLAASGDGKVGFVSSGMDNILAKSGTTVQFATANYTAGSGCKTNPAYIVTHTLEQLW